MRSASGSATGRCLGALLAVCCLAAGVCTPGFCVEPDGARHVATADHLCCDPPAAGPGAGDLVLEPGSSLHECDHAPLSQISGAAGGPDSGRAGAALPYSHPRQADAAPEASGVQSEARPSPLSGPPLLSTALRL